MPLPTIEECLARARREVLSDVERAEMQEGAAEMPIAEPLNPRNEAAALSALYAPARLAQVLGEADRASGDASATTARRRRQELDALAASYGQRTGGRGGGDAPSEEGEVVVVASTEDVDEATAALAAWALGDGDDGASAAVAPAIFSGPARRRWRGLVASRDLSPGDVALCLRLFPRPAPEQQQQQQQPQSRALAVTYASARASDLGRALSALGLDDESLALLFTMADRHDPDSLHAPFWRALPGGGGGAKEEEQAGGNQYAGFGTPLGAGVSDRAVSRALGGTLIGERCEAARRHLADAYASLEPTIAALLRAYPQHLQQAWFTRPAFLWAAELWYAYALQLALPPLPLSSSSLSPSSSASPAPAPVPALVPLFSLANHSAWPHAVAYSDCSADGKQHVRVFRPVKKGEELLISYGALANDELLLFYGFALEGRNPFDGRAVRGQLREEAAAGDGASEAAAAATGADTRRKEWRAAHEAALARVEEDMSCSSGSGGEKWTEAERAFFAHARTLLRGFLAAEAAI